MTFHLTTLRVQSGSFLSSHTDDDDISAFVQEIDARKPLGGRKQQQEGQGENSSEGGSSPSPGPSHERSASESPDPGAADGRRRAASVSFPAMLATEAAVDERLRMMHEQFEASLQGFRRRREREREHDRDRSNGGTITAGRSTRVPTAIPTTFATRRDEAHLESVREMGGGPVPLPSQYVRPRFASTGSARSGVSIASEEVLGRMDPEVGDDQDRYGSRS